MWTVTRTFIKSLTEEGSNLKEKQHFESFLRVGSHVNKNYKDPLNVKHSNILIKKQKANGQH